MAQDTDEDFTQERSGGSAVATATGMAYTRDGDGVAEERLGATAADASQYDNSTNAAQAKALDDMRALEQKIDEVRRHAAARGEQAPNIALPSIDPKAVSGQDLAMLQQQIDRVEEQVRHEEGKQLLEKGGEMAGMLAGLSLAGGGAAGLLASLGISKSGSEMGISGGDNVSLAALGTPEIRNGIEALGQRQQRGGPGLPE